MGLSAIIHLDSTLLWPHHISLDDEQHPFLQDVCTPAVCLEFTYPGYLQASSVARLVSPSSLKFLLKCGFLRKAFPGNPVQNISFTARFPPPYSRLHVHIACTQAPVSLPCLIFFLHRVYHSVTLRVHAVLLQARVWDSFPSETYLSSTPRCVSPGPVMGSEHEVPTRYLVSK